MRHIILLPYYSQKEIDKYLQLLAVWDELDDRTVVYSFLVFARRDAPCEGPLVRACSEKAATRFLRGSVRCKGISAPEFGYNIEGPTGMFWEAMDFVRTHEANDGGFVLWLEADMVPVDRHWLSRLQEEWRKGDYLIMGKYIDAAWIRAQMPAKAGTVPEHINGGACYAKDFSAQIDPNRTNLRRSWDMQSFRQIRATGRYCATELFELRYKSKTLTAPPGPGAVLLHGVKDDSVIRYLKKAVLNNTKVREEAAASGQVRRGQPSSILRRGGIPEKFNQ